MNLEEQAQMLAEKGWWVFPVKREDKGEGRKEYIPQIQWGHQSSNDFEVISGMPWHKATHVGVNCEMSKVWCIDYDSAEALDKFPPLRPGTCQANTKRGKHFYFKAAGFDQRSNASILFRNVDIKANGGMFVMPSDPGPMLDQELADWPFKAVIGKGPKKPVDVDDTLPSTPFGLRALQEAAKAVEEATAGSRNDTLNAEAFWIGQLVGSAQINIHEAMDQLLIAAVNIGLDRKGSLNTIDSGIRAGLTHPVDTGAAAAEAETKQALEDSWFGTFTNIPKRPKPKALCGEWLREGSVAIIHSRAGKGKTALVSDLVYAMQTGGKWLDMDTQSPGKVLWINGDMDYWELTERMGYLGDHAHLWHVPFVDLMTIQDTFTARAEQFGMVVLDNRSCLMPMNDANDAGAWEAPIRLLRKLAHKGITVILINHSGKGVDSSSFGSSAQEWLVQAVLGITSTKANGKENKTLEFQKVRSCKQPDDVEFYLVANGDHLTPVAGHDAADEVHHNEKDEWRIKMEGQIAAQVMRAITDGEPLTERSIQDLCRVKVGPIWCSDADGRSIVKQMLAENKLIKRGKDLLVWEMR